MEDLKSLIKKYFLDYASYVIRDRAIPSIEDGLKPVQRRILYALHMMDNGKLHKVANAVGQTMAFHPHGDAPIMDALVNLANKGYLLDTQGNFGNIFTGDPAAAARYIETRLSPLAKATLFNPQLTQFVPSYDSRQKEPITLPAKIPILLLQGAEGIAVGMSTKILPHNFKELIKAQIAILEGKSARILPDFPTGGIIDVSDYSKGKGKVRVRAKIDTLNDKTLLIKEICYGTTTESLIRSIDEAAKKGKIKIDSIHDYTSEKVEIEIKLPRGQHAEQALDALYAFTDCEVSINSQIIVIKDNLPCHMDVHEILHYNIERLQSFLKKELEIERDTLLEKIYKKTLEEIFIENRLYKKIENIKTYEKIHACIEKSLEAFHKKLSRIPSYEDREFLLHIPIRRISRFDMEKNQSDILAYQDRLKKVQSHLKKIKAFTIAYLKEILDQYGSAHPRRSKIKTLEHIDLKSMQKQSLKVKFDPANGFIGTKVSSETCFECTNLDKVLLIYKDGSYRVINIPEKLYVQQNNQSVAFVGIADKKSIFRVVYKDNKTQSCYAKRFIISKFILDKPYRFLPEDSTLQMISSQEGLNIKVYFKPKPKQKISEMLFHLDDVDVKGVSAKGIRISNKAVKKVSLMKKSK